MTTCKSCQHYDRARTSSYGMAPCTQEPYPYRLARHFSPNAPCNKGKHTPQTNSPNRSTT